MLTRIQRVHNYSRQCGYTTDFTPKQRRRMNKKERAMYRHARQRQAEILEETDPAPACPVCGSMLDVPCITKSGKPAKSPHKGRP